MTVIPFDPLTDPRWPDLLARHPQASVFHSCSWLNALQSTYGYRPVGFTTSTGAALSDGIVFCEVQSWLTGKRLVSLPFSDHCQPLMMPDRLQALLESLPTERKTHRYRYVELRPLSELGLTDARRLFGRSESFSFHSIDLRPDLDIIYRRLHDSCIRRKIKRAEREKLTYECGTSRHLLQQFGQLMLLTRRRHKLPPQPSAWFQNLVRHFGEQIQIHLLSKDSQPVASIFTIRFKQTLVYKYGCSDARFNNLGGTPLLFWKAIQEAKRGGVEDFDLGRSSPEDPGLINFKEHLGGSASALHYYRNPEPAGDQSSPTDHSLVRNLLARLPDPLLTGTGKLLYRHLG